MLSMLSMLSSGMFSQTGAPVVADPSRAPLISNSVWHDCKPRIDTGLALPAPPYDQNCTPACRLSDAASVRPVACSICARSMTVVSASVSSMRAGVRMLVTTTVLNGI